MDDSLSLAQATFIDQACDRFEQAWQDGRPTRIESLLDEAPQDARTALFDELLALEIALRRDAGEDPQSADYLARFTEHAEQVRRVFAACPIDATLSLAPAARPGLQDRLQELAAAQSGQVRFRILRPHAQGGLGEVLLAEDRELKREVALKQIQKQRAHDPESQARFLQEAEITSRLEHPGIVPVYGLGLHEDGRPFYAMRFIQGRSLTEAIADYHQPGEPSEKRLELRQLLNRIIDVCNAVEYAHSRGIVHRDLKPANIMLGKFGETLLVDWGLAKVIGTETDSSGEQTAALAATSGSSGTRHGAVVGTPAYMSPEQAAGQQDRVGPHSDIYSLGATLYCVLTGQAPFGKSKDDILERVQQGLFFHPRAVRPEIDPALESICLKAMNCRPEDRYASAQLLAAELEHWLADEPVAAYREPPLARLSRWSRKHRAWARAGALALVTVSVVSVAAVLIVNGAKVDAQQQRDLANQQKTRAEELAAIAERRRRQAAEASQEALKARTKAEELGTAAKQEARRAGRNSALARRAVDTFLTRLSEEEELKAVGSEQFREELLKTASDFYTRFIEDNPGQVDLQRDLLSAVLKLAVIEHELGRFKAAESRCRALLPLARELARQYPSERVYRRHVADAQLLLGVEYLADGRYREAGASIDEAVELFTALQAEDAQSVDYRHGRARALFQHGLLTERTGRQGIAQFEEALNIVTQLAAEQPDNPTYALDQVRYHRECGRFYGAAEPERAEDQHLSALEIAERLDREYPHDDRYKHARALQHADLAELYAAVASQAGAAQADEYRALALAEFGRARTLNERLAEDHPQVVEYRQQLSRTNRHEAEFLADLDYLDQALALANRALGTSRSLAAADQDTFAWQYELAACHALLADLLAAARQFDEAQKALEDALAVRGRLAASGRAETLRDLAATQLPLGTFFWNRDKLPQAKQALQAALETRQRADQAAGLDDDITSSAFRADCLERLGHLYAVDGKLELARQSYTTALAAYQRLAEHEDDPQWQAGVQRVQLDLDGLDAKPASVRLGLGHDWLIPCQAEHAVVSAHRPGVVQARWLSNRVQITARELGSGRVLIRGSDGKVKSYDVEVIESWQDRTPDAPRTAITIGLGHNHTLPLPTGFIEGPQTPVIAAGNSRVAPFRVLSATHLSIAGRQEGESDLTLISASGKASRYRIVVDAAISDRPLPKSESLPPLAVGDVMVINLPQDWTPHESIPLQVARPEALGLEPLTDRAFLVTALKPGVCDVMFVSYRFQFKTYRIKVTGDGTPPTVSAPAVRIRPAVARGGLTNLQKFHRARWKLYRMEQLLAADQTEPARDAERQAVELYHQITDTQVGLSGYGQRVARGLMTLGYRYLLTEDPARSVELARESLEVAMRLLATDPQQHAYQFLAAETERDLGICLSRTKEHEQALWAFEAAVERLNQLVEAEPQTRKFRLTLAETERDWAIRLGSLSQKIVHLERAIPLFEALRKEHPQDTSIAASLAAACNDVAWVRATSELPALRNSAEAVKRARLACELTEFQNAGYVDTLAAACAEAANFDDAVRWQREAIRRVPPGELQSELLKRLKLYEAGQPYREPVPKSDPPKALNGSRQP